MQGENRKIKREKSHIHMASSLIQITKLTFLWLTIKKENDDINSSFDKFQVLVLKTDGKGLHNKSKKNIF